MSTDEKIAIRLEAGTVLKDRYEVGELLGTGGYAAVYAAEDTLIGRPVAIKVLNIIGLAHDEDQHDRALERFNREAQLAALIDHPNVVTIHDLGTTEKLSQPFIVMERLNGHNLDDELRTAGPMNAARLWPMLARLLDGLAAGHDLGIVHKDLKPSNLFLTHPGTPREDIRIVDFGIARIDEAESTLTGSGQVTGTPQYMAPEYIDSQRVSPALDVYQMGLIIAELLTGARVVDGPNLLSCVLKHTHRQFKLDPRLLDSPLGPILMKALEKNPDRRHTDAGALRDALDNIAPETLPHFEHTPRSRGGDSEEYAPSSDTPQPALALPSLSGEVTLDARPRPNTDLPTLHTSEPSPPIAPHAPTTPSLSQEITPQRPLWPAALALTALLILLSGGAWYAAQQPDVPAPQNPTTQPPPEAPKEPDPKPTAKAQPEPKAQGPKPKAQKEPKAQPAPILVEVRSHPCKATFYEGHQSLGQAPLKVTFTAGDTAPKRLTARCRGYDPRTFSVRSDQGPALTIRLKAEIQFPD